jgi:hypothetical protein
MLAYTNMLYREAERKMKKNKFKLQKAGVLTVMSLFIVVAFAPTITSQNNTNNNTIKIDIIKNNQPILSLEEIQQTQRELYRNVELGRGWYWKPSYPNYAPNQPGGMPDFDQKQDQWKTIEPGPNGIIDSVLAGDDVFNVAENCIAPGLNCHLQSVPANDDVAVWSFCGPVAVANCLWWFDSKYSTSTGTPGDGEDNFALVEDYGVGDDHSANNVPLLIENLARYFQTNTKGTTYITDMQDGIDDWLVDAGLDDKFEENTYNKPQFDFVEEEIERCQDVILLMGYYDVEMGPKLIDQQQPVFSNNDNLNIVTWGDYQSFVPSATRLDAISIFLVSNGPVCNVEINVYNTAGGNPIGTSVLNPGSLPVQTWVQFHFDPYIPLTPGSTYYFDVRELDTIDNLHYEWFYMSNPDSYPLGQGWLDSLPVSPYGPFDWTFLTEYYDPTSTRMGGHYVTCAGVNSEELKIAFSDPCWDIQNPTPDYTKHNDPQYVSHDIYDVGIGCPVPGLDYKWWIKNYAAACNYTVVEQAVVICPLNTPPDKPDKPSGQASGKINVEYTYTTSTTDPNGDQVSYWFDWGDGTNSGWVGPYASGATGSAKHTWTVKGSYQIKVKAKDTSSAESVWSDPLPIKMPCSIDLPMFQILEKLLERFPHMFPILRHLLVS